MTTDIPPPDADDPAWVTAEQRCIGSCLFDARIIPDVAAICGPEDFLDPLHQRLFAAMSEAPDGGGSVTLDSVCATLGDDAGLAEVGGRCYLEEMVAVGQSCDPLSLAKDIAALAAARDSSQTSAGETESVVPESFDILPMFSAAEFDGKPVPPRDELVEDRIPAGKVTIIGGDGGTGKSLLALMLAVAMQLHINWLGKLVHKNGPVLFLTAEEDPKEMHRRLHAILGDVGQPFTKLQHLHICPLVGRNALLAEKNERGALVATELYHALKTRVAALKPDLVVLDTLADVFGGNEIDRTQARRFIGMLTRICIDEETTILLLAHPSLAGMATGTGSSGSTGWNNSVRSRLYLERVGNDDDPDRRVLRSMKANYGPTGEKIPLRWERGVFKVIKDGEEDYAARARDAKADRIFIDCLTAYTGENRSVGPNPGANYAPAVFAGDKRSEGVGKARLRDAMNRLLEKKRIEIRVEGPPSRQTKRLIVAAGF
jgi:RecA-family ATPase